MIATKRSITMHKRRQFKDAVHIGDMLKKWGQHMYYPVGRPKKIVSVSERRALKK